MYEKYIVNKKSYYLLKINMIGGLNTNMIGGLNTNMIGGLKITIIKHPDMTTVSINTDNIHLIVLYDTYSETKYSHYIDLKYYKDSKIVYQFNLSNVLIDSKITNQYKFTTNAIMDISETDRKIIKLCIEKLLLQIDDKERKTILKNNIMQNIEWYDKTELINENDIIDPNVLQTVNAIPIPAKYESKYDPLKNMDKLEEITMFADLVKIFRGYLFSNQDAIDYIFKNSSYDITFTSWDKFKSNYDSHYEKIQKFFDLNCDNCLKIYFINKSLNIDKTITQGHGHTLVGTSTYFNFDDGITTKKKYVYKKTSMVHKLSYDDLTILPERFVSIYELILKFHKMTKAVGSNIVQVANKLIINIENDTLVVGYLMELIDGITVRDLITHDKKEFIDNYTIIYAQLKNTLEKLTTDHKFNIDDFELDNIMWSKISKTLTVIDLEEKGFNNTYSGASNALALLEHYYYSLTK